jgi:hypothetical protein
MAENDFKISKLLPYYRESYPSGLPQGAYSDLDAKRPVPAGAHYEALSGTDITAMVVLPKPSPAALQEMGVDPDFHQGESMIKIFAELQTLSISSARSASAVRRLGESHVHQYTRGGRTIAGTMVFTTFNRDVFSELYHIHPEEDFDPATPMHVDQLPEFNILIQGCNEYGAMIQSGLIGVTLLNFGTTLSIHDLMIESTYTYVARYYYPMMSSLRSFYETSFKNTLEQKRQQDRAASELPIILHQPGAFDSNPYSATDPRYDLWNEQMLYGGKGSSPGVRRQKREYP